MIFKKTIKKVFFFFNRLKKKVKKKIVQEEYKKSIMKKDYPKKEKLVNTKKYWRKYTKKIRLYNHVWLYKENEIYDCRYIPSDIFYYDILPVLNDEKLAEAYADKSMYKILFDDVILPTTFLKNINGVFFDNDFNFIDYKKTLKEISSCSKLIIKPSIDSGGGKSIVVLDEKNSDLMYELLKKEIKKFEKNFIIQKYISQSKTISKMNPTSVNTVRIMSLMHNNKIEILSPHIRVGINENLIDQNGMIVGIDNNGTTKHKAYKSRIGTKMEEHPQGHDIFGIKIPNFHKIIEIVASKHKKLAHFKIISWDFAINDKDLPLLIEINLRYPGIDHHQLISGPLFGDLTDEILDYVYK